MSFPSFLDMASRIALLRRQSPTRSRQGFLAKICDCTNLQLTVLHSETMSLLHSPPPPLLGLSDAPRLTVTKNEPPPPPPFQTMFQVRRGPNGGAQGQRGEKTLFIQIQTGKNDHQPTLTSARTDQSLLPRQTFLCVCLICMPYMYACMHVYASYVCLTCMRDCNMGTPCMLYKMYTC